MELFHYVRLYDYMDKYKYYHQLDVIEQIICHLRETVFEKISQNRTMSSNALTT